MTHRDAPCRDDVQRHVCPEIKHFADLCDQHLLQAGEHAFGYGLGFAPDDIALDDRSATWVINTGEYVTPILFCPWCGGALVESSVADRLSALASKKYSIDETIDG